MGVVENIKDFGDFVNKYNDIELNRRILKLEEEVLDLARDKRRLEEKVEELQRALRFSGELVFKKPFYFLKDDPNPFCPGCWDSKRQANHVTRVRLPQMGVQMHCPVCMTNYGPLQV